MRNQIFSCSEIIFDKYQCHLRKDFNTQQRLSVMLKMGKYTPDNSLSTSLNNLPGVFDFLDYEILIST